MNRIVRSLEKNWLILLIITIAFILRAWRLNYQSLWLDELYTLNETDPHISWGQLFVYLKCCDSAPPLFFIFEKLFLSIFGYTETVARSVSVIAGTLGVWSMYLLGKEVLNKRLGLFAAILTTFNFYGLSYSQEARVYSFAFLFAALSFMYFIRLIKVPSKKNVIVYSLFTICLLYSHYYSLFIVVAQAVLALLFILQEHGKERKILFRFFLLSAVIIIVGYLPWVPYLIAVSRISSSWIHVPNDFLQKFFFEYFDNSELLKPLLLLLLFAYFFRVSLNSGISFNQKIRTDPLLFSFVISLIWIFVTLLIPYLRSLLVIPMLYGRYTIVILPAVILIIAYSIELFRNPVVTSLLIALFVIMSLIDLFFVRKYYTTPSKTQFREMTEYVVRENTSNYPLINEVSSWQQQFYLKKFQSKAEVFSGKKENLVDSILKKTSMKYKVQGFWLVGAHNDPYLSDKKRKELDTAYTLLKEKKFLDAWAQLFISKKDMGGIVIIHHTDFTDGTIVDPGVLAIWNGTVHTKPFF